MFNACPIIGLWVDDSFQFNWNKWMCFAFDQFKWAVGHDSVLSEWIYIETRAKEKEDAPSLWWAMKPNHRYHIIHSNVITKMYLRNYNHFGRVWNVWEEFCHTNFGYRWWWWWWRRWVVRCCWSSQYFL